MLGVDGLGMRLYEKPPRIEEITAPNYLMYLGSNGTSLAWPDPT